MPGLELHSGFLEGFLKSWGVILASGERQMGTVSSYVVQGLTLRNAATVWQVGP